MRCLKVTSSNWNCDSIFSVIRRWIFLECRSLETVEAKIFRRVSNTKIVNTMPFFNFVCWVIEVKPWLTRHHKLGRKSNFEENIISVKFAYHSFGWILKLHLSPSNLGFSFICSIKIREQYKNGETYRKTGVPNSLSIGSISMKQKFLSSQQTFEKQLFLSFSDFELRKLQFLLMSSLN